MNFIVGEYYRMRGQPAAALDVVRCMKIAHRDGTNFDTCNPDEWEHVRIVPATTTRARLETAPPAPVSPASLPSAPGICTYCQVPRAQCSPWSCRETGPATPPPGPPEIRSCQTCEHCGMDMDMDPYCAHPAVLVQHSHGLVTRHALPLFCGGDDHNLWTPRKPR